MANQKNSGFTLIELLIVLMIIGVVMSLVSLNIGARPSAAKQEAKQLQSLLTLAREDAILKGQILGWKISPENYAFYRYQDKKWLPITADKLLKTYSLNPEVTFELTLDNTKINIDKESLPQIVLLPDGSSNQFLLGIVLKDSGETYQVFMQQGKITSRLVEKEK